MEMGIEMELGKYWKEENLLGFTYLFFLISSHFLLQFSSWFFLLLSSHTLCFMPCVFGLLFALWDFLPAACWFCCCLYLSPISMPSSLLQVYRHLVFTCLLCVMASNNGLKVYIQTFSEFTLKVNAVAENKDLVI